MARRNGTRWFVGALTDRHPRDITVRLDFLGPGSWKAIVWKDAQDSDTVAEHLERDERSVSSTDSLNLHLARCGGAVVEFAR